MNADPHKTPNPLASALGRWSNEGGAQPATPVEESESIIRHLGAAVLMLWKHFPREIQRDLFDAASEMEEPNSNTDAMRHHLALFLHHNKKRDSDVIDEGGGD